GHDRLPTFGVGGELDAKGWRAVFRQLVARGLLAVDADGLNVLRLTPRAWPVLRGEERLALREERRPERKRRRKAEPAAGDEALFPETRRFEALRALRKELAEAAGVPPYLIFHDRTLKEIAARVPATLAELAGVPGVGAKKLERYGERVLRALAEVI
ncbi:MAG TPA: HRDC domain-containing protein, partial [Thermoanaerobaculia bacterium]|nr:HRDC domain-containing protein [Thermoanaerobaculia bacterium]